MTYMYVPKWILQKLRLEGTYPILLGVKHTHVCLVIGWVARVSTHLRLYRVAENATMLQAIKILNSHNFGSLIIILKQFITSNPNKLYTIASMQTLKGRFLCRSQQLTCIFRDENCLLLSLEVLSQSLVRVVLLWLKTQVYSWPYSAKLQQSVTGNGPSSVKGLWRLKLPPPWI